METNILRTVFAELLRDITDYIRDNGSLTLKTN